MELPLIVAKTTFTANSTQNEPRLPSFDPTTTNI